MGMPVMAPPPGYPYTAYTMRAPAASHVVYSSHYGSVVAQAMNPALAGTVAFPWPAPQGTIVLKGECQWAGCSQGVCACEVCLTLCL
jgi:hypothetical protein